MESRSVFVETRKYYKKLCYTKYVSETAKLNEMNKYFRDYLGKISIRTISHVLTPERALPRIT